jgi:hypothetical protein
MSRGWYLIIADGVVDRPYAVNGYLLPPITCTQYTESPHTDQRGFDIKPRARVAQVIYVKHKFLGSPHTNSKREIPDIVERYLFNDADCSIEWQNDE